MAAPDKQKASGLQLAAGVAALLVLVVAIALAVAALWQLFRGLQKEVAAALVAGMTTVVVSMVSLTAGRYFQRQAEIDESIREKKTPIYEEFVEFWFRYIFGEKTGTKPTDAEMLAFFSKFTQTLTFWGSDDVVRRYAQWRGMFVGGSTPDGSATLFELESLLLAMRRDVGHKNKGVERGTLLKLFINDLPDG